MKEIVLWRQGCESCVGYDSTKQAFGWDTKNGEMCLMMAGDWGHKEAKALAGIIGRLFPERACQCSDLNWSTWDHQKVVHFNNHPETTRDMIDKIIHTYEMEVEG